MSAVAIALGSSAFAKGTPAGTLIDSVASVSYLDFDGKAATATSNKVSLKVDEVLGVNVVSTAAEATTMAGESAQVLNFTLTNAGNGSEAFLLTARDSLSGDDFDPSITSLVLDSNANQAYDVAADATYVAGSNNPIRAADGSTTIFVLSSIPAAAEAGHKGRIEITAKAATGSGNPGISFPSAGDGGGDAVVGPTGAVSEAGGFYRVESPTISFTKRAEIEGGRPGDVPAAGATITYTLVATVKGSSPLKNLRISDSIPSDTTYRPGSMSLEGAPLSDAADEDSGSFAGNAVKVTLARVGVGESRTVKFSVTINGEKK